MPAFIDLTDQTFFKLRVLNRNPVNTVCGKPRWNCICVCGNYTIVPGRDLRNGASSSCGCWKSEVNSRIHKGQTHSRIHGFSETAEYDAWIAIKQRCYNSNSSGYHRYGGRGITMCNRWEQSFENFLEDMGRRPSDQHSVDRQNNDGDYEPGNCAWATPQEQANNRSTNTYHEFEGERLTSKQVSLKTGVKYHNLTRRLREGMDILTAINLEK